VNILAIVRPRNALFLLVDSGQRKDDNRGLPGPVCLALTERLQIEDFLCARGIFRRFADICTQAALSLDFMVYKKCRSSEQYQSSAVAVYE